MNWAPLPEIAPSRADCRHRQNRAPGVPVQRSDHSPRRKLPRGSGPPSPPTSSSPAPQSIILEGVLRTWASSNRRINSIRPGSIRIIRPPTRSAEPRQAWPLQPSNPALLNALAQSFIDSGYDISALMRLIANSMPTSSRRATTALGSPMGNSVRPQVGAPLVGRRDP